MAQIQLKPPEPFNFKTPDDWPRWKRRFGQFRVASGLIEESPTKQVNTLLYCLGEEAYPVLASTHATEEEKKSYDSVLGKFDSFFKVRKNVIFERARFNRRNQLNGESAEQYIMELYTLLENCDFNEMKGEMIRDRLVVGIKDSALSERLQLDSNFTLEMAEKAIRQREAVQEQQLQLKGVGQGILPVLEELKTGGREHSKGNEKRPKAAMTRYSLQPKQYCKRCGKGQHRKEKCPARDASCHRCHRKRHYSSRCLSKSISELEAPLIQPSSTPYQTKQKPPGRRK